MSIPDYETVMLPLLQLVRDCKIHKFSDAVDSLATQFKITETEIRELLPSGKYPVFRSRVGWAKTYLTKAGLLELPVRGSMQITKLGIELLDNNVQKINSKFLHRYPDFVEFIQNSKPDGNNKNKSKVISPVAVIEEPKEEKTPDEILEYA